MILFKVVKNQLKQEKRWLWIISDDVFTVFLSGLRYLETRSIFIMV